MKVCHAAKLPCGIRGLVTYFVFGLLLIKDIMMDRELAETLVQALEDEGYDVSLYESYSGRGMYGKETSGVVLNDCGITEALSAVINNATMFIAEENEPIEFFDLSERFDCRGFRQDSMGRGIIIY